MTLEEINHEISQLEPAEVNTRNVQVLSSLYVIRDNLGVGYAPKIYQMPTLTGSAFNEAISGKNVSDVLAVLNEAVEAMQALLPNLYKSMIYKLNDL